MYIDSNKKIITFINMKKRVKKFNNSQIKVPEKLTINNEEYATPKMLSNNLNNWEYEVHQNAGGNLKKLKQLS